MAEIVLTETESKQQYRIKMQFAAKHEEGLQSLFRDGPKYSRRFLMTVVHCAVVNHNIKFLEELLDSQKAIIITDVEAGVLFQELWRNTKTFPAWASLVTALWMLNRPWKRKGLDPSAYNMLRNPIDGMEPELQISLLERGIKRHGSQFVKRDKWFKQRLQRWAAARRERRYSGFVEVEIGGDEDLEWRNFIKCHEVVNKEHVRCWIKSGPHVPDNRAPTKPRTVYYECGACVKTNGYAKPRTDYACVIDHMTRHRQHPYLFTEGFCNTEK